MSESLGKSRKSKDTSALRVLAIGFGNRIQVVNMNDAHFPKKNQFERENSKRRNQGFWFGIISQDLLGVNL